jgi:hypothetical protein
VVTHSFVEQGAAPCGPPATRSARWGAPALGNRITEVHRAESRSGLQSARAESRSPLRCASALSDAFAREEYCERLQSTPVRLCRLRYFGRDDVWSMAFYTYSHERYQPCSVRNGSSTGTPERAFEIGSLYLE